VAFVGVDAAHLPWLDDEGREAVYVISLIPQSPALELDGFGVIVTDINMLVRLRAASAIVEDIDDLDIARG